MSNDFKGVQREILESIKKNQLVSAGAGSGKTTIMVEKIARLILNNQIDVENLLVVTFTVLAASEMKERLISRLKSELDNQTNEEKEITLKNIEKLETASIDTIDGFSSKTIKKYFYALNISPNVQILSDATGDYYFSKSMKKTIDDFMLDFENSNILLDFYGGGRRNFDSIKELVKTIYFDIINIEDYKEFLTASINEYSNLDKTKEYINDKIKRVALSAKAKIIENYSFLTNESKQKIDEFENAVEDLINEKDFRKIIVKFLNLKMPSKRAGKGEKDEAFCALVDSFGSLESLQEKFIKNKIDENFEEYSEKIVNFAQIFINLLKNFIKNYQTLKEKNNLIDFNDLNRLMLKLLQNKEIKTELNNQYKYIFVDEFQDVNPLQEKLINAITGENAKCFFVGDVKQSIYGFRGATPEAFLKKYEKYKSNKDDESAFNMNYNFRSSENILNFVNVIFEKIMDKNQADIDYKNDCMIEPKNKEIVGEIPHIYLIDDDKEKRIAKGIYSVKNSKEENYIDSKTKEAYCVLDIITKTIEQKFYDPKIKAEREFTYKDIAILSHSDKDENAKILIDILRANNVPVGINNKLDVKNSEGVGLVISILKCVSGIADDVDYLASFMALTNLNPDDLLKIRNKEKSFYENLVDNISLEQVAIGFKKLEEIRNKSYVSTNKELILYILENQKLKYYFLQKENGEKEIETINELIQKFSSVEDGLNLNEFIEVIESSVKDAGDFETKDNENSVTIQTIHKSKGLEYPVVILFNSAKNFVKDNDAISFNLDLGLGFDYFDIENRTKSSSLTKLAIGLKNAEKSYKEEMRLLYVALTRAKNKLFITGIIKDEDINKSDFNKTNFLKMILSCFAGQINEEKTVLKSCVIEKINSIGKMALKKTNDRACEILYEGFVYPNKLSVPVKNTVTGINSKIAENSGFKTRDWLTKTIQFGQDENETNNLVSKNIVGTHYHKVLENIDFLNEYKVEKVFDDVDYKIIKLAYEKLSSLCAGAIKLHKEAEFMMYVPYNQVVESDVTKKVLIQGVCDLIVERDDCIDIVDYKFSNLNGKVLKEKYMEQLRLYKLAVENAFKKSVKNTYIYSIKTGELI